MERVKVLRLTEELKKLVKESHDLKKKLAGPEVTIELYDFKWIEEMRVETLKQTNPEAQSKAERWNLEKKMAKKLESLKTRLNEKVSVALLCKKTCINKVLRQRSRRILKSLSIHSALHLSALREIAVDYKPKWLH